MPVPSPSPSPSATPTVAGNIYISNSTSVTVYNANGLPINTITGSGNVAVGASGKIYFEQATTNGSPLGPSSGPNNGTITTLLANGTPTTPTISGLGDLRHFAVDAVGNIYVTQLLPSALLIFNASGTLTSTITAGLNEPNGVAVDGFGKIYVTDSNSSTGQGMLTTFLANGTQTTPSILAPTEPGSAIGFHGVAVDGSGNVYLTQSGSGTSIFDALTVYNANGILVKTITAGIKNPGGVAVDANGKIYISDSFSGTLTTYLANGVQTTPTITGLTCCFSAAVH